MGKLHMGVAAHECLVRALQFATYRDNHRGSTCAQLVLRSDLRSGLRFGRGQNCGQDCGQAAGVPAVGCGWAVVWLQFDVQFG